MSMWLSLQQSIGSSQCLCGYPRDKQCNIKIDTIEMHPTLNTKEIKLDILSSIFRHSKTTESERLLLGTDLWF